MVIKDPYADREAEKYDNPIPSREFILEYLADRGKPATREQLISEFELENDDQIEALRRRLIAMVRDGQMLMNRRGAYGPLDKMELIAGRVIGHKDGFGFVVPDIGGEDIFLGPRQMRLAFHGDRVLARVSNIDTRGRREGIIVEVLEHNTKQLVGRLYSESGASFVEPSNQRIPHDILIPPDSLGDAEHGQMVVVAITGQPTQRTRPIGQIIEILGDHMAPGMEINVAIRNHDLPHVWPDEALSDASRFEAEVPLETINERLDLRHLPFVTIDGEDAKDFDDAVYCQPANKGGWVLYVAIADVSHYVKPDSALDREAFLRGNSVYFPGRVIPMLPEVLSNNLCSLNPHVDRLAMVAEMEISKTGEIISSRFYDCVIKSHARLTYNQVHAMMEKQNARVKGQHKTVLPHLENLYRLFNILKKAREKRGTIDFDMPETKIVFGANRKIKEIVAYERYDSHRLIEECMLCANISAARFLIQHEQPTLFRIHQGPSAEKLKDLRRFLKEMAIPFVMNEDPKPADYARILRTVKDRPDFHLIQTILLRSMSQAVYSPENKGHFGLSYDAYAHFTSPIRRYPDLLVHRGIRQILQKKSLAKDYAATLEQRGAHCSMTERRADDATEEAKDWLKCEFMLNKVGNDFAGVISGVTGFGVFVELTDIYIEGLIHISTLPEDYYQFDAIKHELHGERTGKKYRLGDSIKIKVAQVSLDERKIDFVLAEGARTKREKSEPRPLKKNKKERAVKSKNKTRSRK